MTKEEYLLFREQFEEMAASDRFAGIIAEVEKFENEIESEKFKETMMGFISGYLCGLSVRVFEKNK